MTETAAFLTLCSEKYADRCEQALQTLQQTPIYNVDFKDAKYWLDRAVEEAWKEQVRKPYLWGRGGDNAESDLDMHIGSVHNLNDVIARAKKLATCKPTTKLGQGGRTFQDVNPECVAAIRNVLDAALPIALMVKELKSQVVKGRKPSKPSEAKLEALAKEAAKMTCPCCFRAMVVKDGKIVRHGWKEAGGRRAGQYGNTWHMGECFGVGYEPYEVSDLGTRKFKEYLEGVLVQEEKGLENLKARPAKLHYQKRVRRNMRWETEMVTVEDDGQPLERSYSSSEPTYADVLLDAIYRQEQKLKALRSDIATLTTAIEQWKKVA